MKRIKSLWVLKSRWVLKFWCTFSVVTWKLNCNFYRITSVNLFIMTKNVILLWSQFCSGKVNDESCRNAFSFVSNSKRAERSQEEVQRHWPRYCSFCALLLGQSLPCMLKLMLVRIQRLFRGCTGRTLSLMLRNICEGWFWLSSRMECICKDDTDGANVLVWLTDGRSRNYRTINPIPTDPHQKATRELCESAIHQHIILNIIKIVYLQCQKWRILPLH